MSSLSHYTGEVLSTLPHGVEDPRVLALAGVVLVGGAAIDYLVDRREHRLEKAGFPIADPEIAGAVMRANRSTRRRERAGHYLATFAIGLGVAQLAHPYTVHSHDRGGVTVIFDATYRANAQDMAGHESRLDAAYNGTLKAAATEDVPFSFVAAGQNAVPVATLPARHKDVNSVTPAFRKVLTASFRNGNTSMPYGVSLRAAVTAAEGGNADNKIIILSAEPYDLLDDSSKGASNLSRAEAAKTYAIVPGTTKANYEVGNSTYNAPTDMLGFETVLPKGHVVSATDETTIERAVEAVAKQQEPIEYHRESNLPLELAGVSGALLALMTIKRRVSALMPKVRLPKLRKGK